MLDTTFCNHEDRNIWLNFFNKSKLNVIKSDKCIKSNIGGKSSHKSFDEKYIGDQRTVAGDDIVPNWGNI